MLRRVKVIRCATVASALLVGGLVPAARADASSTLTDTIKVVNTTAGKQLVVTGSSGSDGLGVGGETLGTDGEWAGSASVTITASDPTTSSGRRAHRSASSSLAATMATRSPVVTTTTSSRAAEATTTRVVVILVDDRTTSRSMHGLHLRR